MKEPSNADVSIVGSGIAGTTIAYLLTKWGHRVAMFEVGPMYDYPFLKQYTDEIVHLYRDPRYKIGPGLRKLEVTGDYRDLEPEQYLVVGGMASHWSGWTPRWLPSHFETKRRFGYGVDWPIRYADIEPYYCKAEAHLGISGTDDDNPFAPPRSKPYPLPPFEFGYGDKVLAGRLKEKNIVLHTAPQARTRAPYDGRPACANTGVCGVCPIGARYAPQHHLRLAMETGRLTLETNAAVRRILADRDGVVSGLLFYRDNRQATESSARTLVVAAGAIESARLLLLSAREGGAAGRINQSGQVGQNLMFPHIWPAIYTYAEPLYTGRMGPATAECHQFAEPPGQEKHGGLKIDFSSNLGVFHRDYAGGAGDDWEEGVPSLHPPWHNRQELLKEVDRGRFQREVGIHAESVPTPEKYVGLSKLVDRFGDPVARVQHQSNEFDEAAKQYAFSIAKLFASATRAKDFEQVQEFSTGHHHHGTCRMGSDPAHAVVDSYGQVHGFRNLFVAGASIFASTSPFNPTLTIVALAIRTAERIHASLS
jgi:choline dehydrogenase-like flavoprotein